MTFKTQASSDLPVFFNTNEFAETITYNDEEISAIVDYGFERQAIGENVRTATIIVQASDVANPGYRDTVVIGSTTWRVYRDADNEPAIKGDGYVWSLILTRAERPVW